MAATVAIAPPEPMEKEGNIADNWQKWRRNFEIYLVASGIDQKDDKIACAHFLHCIGQHGKDIFFEQEFGDSEGNQIDDLFVKFENYCNPKTNMTFNRYEFFNTKQGKKQSFDVFLSALKKKSKNCEFGDLNNSLMMTQIISGISNIVLRARLLRMPDLDLNRTIEECRATEASEAQAEKIDSAKKTKAPTKEKEKKASAKAPSTKNPTSDATKKKRTRKPKSAKSQEQPQQAGVASETAADFTSFFKNALGLE